MFLDHLFSFLHRKRSKTAEPSAIDSHVTTTTTATTIMATSETPSTRSHASVVEEEPEERPPLPQVEFEESRHLLQLDFFGSDKEQALTFPKFDYLLQPVKQVDESTIKKPRKSSTTLRHRISLYRPSSKTVKRSLSSPNIYNQQ